MDYVLDDITNEPIGFYQKWKDQTGVCIYGNSEILPEGSFQHRCSLAIALGESPLRHPTNPTRIISGKASRNTVQNYEYTDASGPWISAGMMQAISKPGNNGLQAMLGKVFTAHSDLEDIFNSYGFFLVDNEICINDNGSFIKLVGENVRNKYLAIVIHHILADDKTDQQVMDHFWQFNIMPRFKSVVEPLGWMDAALEDERLYFLLSSLSINAGVSVMKACLNKAKAKTAQALTDSRVQVYGSLKGFPPNFGKSRALSELKSTLLHDGVKVEL